MAEFRIRVMSLQAESIGSNLVFSAGSAIIRTWQAAKSYGRSRFRGWSYLWPFVDASGYACLLQLSNWVELA